MEYIVEKEIRFMDGLGRLYVYPAGQGIFDKDFLNDKQKDGFVKSGHIKVKESKMQNKKEEEYQKDNTKVKREYKKKEGTKE